MYPVTKTTADNFKTNALQYLSILVNPVTGSSFEITSADVLAGGLEINRYSANGDSIALGSCVAAELNLRLENGDGRFDSIVFEGAQLVVSVGTPDGDNIAWIPLGYFTVDNAPRRLAVITITALDGMVQFDKEVNMSALNLPTTVKNLVTACCNECNIILSTDLDTLPNKDYSVTSVGEQENLTYRSILAWCCQIMGVCGFMDWQGHLELSWYKKDGILRSLSGNSLEFSTYVETPITALNINIEPYQSGRGTPSPDNVRRIYGFTEANISDYGTNLLDKSAFVQGSIDWQGADGASTARLRSPKVFVKPSTTYSVAVNSEVQIFEYHLYKMDGSWSYETVNASSWSFTTPADVQYVKFLVRYSDNATITTEDLTSAYLNEGTSIKEVDYNGHLYTFSFSSAGTVYGGTLDAVNGILTVTHKMKNFDSYTGTITKSGSTAIPSGRIVWYVPAFTDSPNSGGDGNTAHVYMKCSIYDIQDKSYQSNVIPATEFAMGIGRASGHAMVGFNVDSTLYGEKEDFRAWLQASHCDIWYPLETAVIYQLTPPQMATIVGDNTLSAEAGNFSVTFTEAIAISPAERYNSDIYENAVTITGVQVKGKENQALYGTDDYALNIEGNDLIRDEDCETVANGLSSLVGFSYHPFSASVLPMPYLYPLDIVAVEYKGAWYDCALTETNFVATSPTSLKGTGESAQTKSYARLNPLTNRERAIIESVKTEVNATLNKAINNLADFNQIISNALGLYHTNVSDGQGGFIRYLHNAPDLESSTYIVTETAQGFAWTNNGWNGGSPVWSYGVTSGGYALFKWLSAEGIDVTKASSDYRAEVTPEHFNIYYKNDLIITIDATERAIKTPRIVIPYSSTSNNMLRVGQLVWMPTPNGANAVVLGS